MKKKKKAGKSVKKPGAPKPIEKPARVTCGTCGEERDAGAPHAGFCRGTKETKCSECEAEASEELLVVVCRDCGKVFCDDCGDTGDRLCSDCVEGE